nr:MULTISPECIES: hypothetical protein [Mycobacteriaceae]
MAGVDLISGELGVDQNHSRTQNQLARSISILPDELSEFQRPGPPTLLLPAGAFVFCDRKAISHVHASEVLEFLLSVKHAAARR